MNDLVYVTGNVGKKQNVRRHFNAHGIPIDFCSYSFEEPEVDDITYISQEKAKQAYSYLERPCLVADSGFYIVNYPGSSGYPGVFVKRSGVSTNIENLLDTLETVTDRSCYFLDCMTFYDGQTLHSFYGRNDGTLAREIRGQENPNAQSRLWFVFIPKNCTKTLAEMSETEFVNRKDGRTSASEQFIEWYQEQYLPSTSKVLRKD